MEEFLQKAKKLAYNETEKYGTPAVPIINLSTDIGKKIAKKIGANVGIVEAGTLLMDCALGQALKENRRKEHVKMSLEKANLLMDNSTLSENEKENICNCILEHHGTDKFYSLESEICCNADCYRFILAKGFAFQIRYGRDMSFSDMVDLLKEKVNEKWNALSLDICKKELAEEYNLITEFLKKMQ
jgi:hypothetical protein